MSCKLTCWSLPGLELRFTSLGRHIQIISSPASYAGRFKSIMQVSNANVEVFSVLQVDINSRCESIKDSHTGNVIEILMHV